MVIYPKSKQTYCSQCQTHTSHRIRIYKKGEEGNFSQGVRHYKHKQSGYGGQTKPIPTNKSKTTKKITILLQCIACRHKKQEVMGRSLDVVLIDQKQIMKLHRGKVSTLSQSRCKQN